MNIITCLLVLCLEFLIYVKLGCEITSHFFRSVISHLPSLRWLINQISIAPISPAMPGSVARLRIGFEQQRKIHRCEVWPWFACHPWLAVHWPNSVRRYKERGNMWPESFDPKVEENDHSPVHHFSLHVASGAACRQESKWNYIEVDWYITLMLCIVWRQTSLIQFLGFTHINIK